MRKKTSRRQRWRRLSNLHSSSFVFVRKKRNRWSLHGKRMSNHLTLIVGGSSGWLWTYPFTHSSTKVYLISSLDCLFFPSMNRWANMDRLHGDCIWVCLWWRKMGMCIKLWFPYENQKIPTVGIYSANCQCVCITTVPTEKNTYFRKGEDR